VETDRQEAYISMLNTETLIVILCTQVWGQSNKFL